MWGYISFISRNIDKKQLAKSEMTEAETDWGWDRDHSSFFLFADHEIWINGSTYKTDFLTDRYFSLYIFNIFRKNMLENELEILYLLSIHSLDLDSYWDYL